MIDLHSIWHTCVARSSSSSCVLLIHLFIHEALFLVLVSLRGGFLVRCAVALVIAEVPVARVDLDVVREKGDSDRFRHRF